MSLYADHIRAGRVEDASRVLCEELRALVATRLDEIASNHPNSMSCAIGSLVAVATLWWLMAFQFPEETRVASMRVGAQIAQAHGGGA
jgi:hypothetical protein